MQGKPELWAADILNAADVFWCDTQQSEELELSLHDMCMLSRISPTHVNTPCVCK